MLARVAELTGRPIEHIATSDEESLRAFGQGGLPAGFPQASLGFDIWARGGYHAISTGAVKELAGHEPQSLGAFLAQHRDILTGGRVTVDI